ncbi:MAG TPA: integrase core domain-containing protein [Acidimicrobiales bacterium]|nr:integrase core domain-containing protein [Acidimicrobiales bacterium]
MSSASDHWLQLCAERLRAPNSAPVAPNCSPPTGGLPPFAERSVGTVRRECRDRTLIFGRRHLERVLAENVALYNGHRPHRALGQQAPLLPSIPPAADHPAPTRLHRSDAVFGLIREYRLVA